MACFKLQIGGKEFQISSPSDNSNEVTGASFIETLSYASNEDPELIPTILWALDQAEKAAKTKPLQEHVGRDFPYIVQDNLQRLGVEMTIHKTDSDWADYCAKNNISSQHHAFVHNGQIHVKASDFKVQYAMHEFAHLILSYVQATDPTAYQRILNVLSTNPKVKQLIESYQGPASSYTGIQEEAVVSFIETWFDEDSDLDLSRETVTVQGIQYDLLGYMSGQLSKPIQELFGLPEQNIPIFLFFNSLLADIGNGYGCELVVGKPMPKTGYSEHKNEVTRAVQTKALIDHYLDQGELSKTQC